MVMEGERSDAAVSQGVYVETVANSHQSTNSEPISESKDLVEEDPFVHRSGKRVCTGEEPSSAAVAQGSERTPTQNSSEILQRYIDEQMDIPAPPSRPLIPEGVNVKHGNFQQDE